MKVRIYITAYSIRLLAMVHYSDYTINDAGGQASLMCLFLINKVSLYTNRLYVKKNCFNALQVFMSYFICMVEALLTLFMFEICHKRCNGRFSLIWV